MIKQFVTHLISMYRIIHKGWDCKDDLKIFNYYDAKVETSLLPKIKPWKGLLNDLAKKEKSLYSLNSVSVQSSLHYHDPMNKNLITGVKNINQTITMFYKLKQWLGIHLNDYNLQILLYSLQSSFSPRMITQF